MLHFALPRGFLTLCIASGVITTAAMARTISISNYEDFKRFADDVSTSQGATVLLEADIDLRQLYSPVIGFSGTFDGQGHVLKNINYNQPERDSALFTDITKGATVKNVIIDQSCTFSSTSNKENTFVSSVLGLCTASNTRCAVLNSVSMATITFTGYYGTSEEEGGEDESRSIYIGGIMGRCVAQNYECIVRNTVNYGEVTFSGDGNYVYVGGIAGSYESVGNPSAYLQNVLNYGVVSVNLAADFICENIFVGGIIGFGRKPVAEGCVNAGLIKGCGDDTAAGSLFGEIEKTENVTHCYYLIDTFEKGIGSSVDEDGTIEGNIIGIEIFYDDLEPDSSVSELSSSSISGSSSGELTSMLNVPSVIERLNNYVSSNKDLFLSGWILNVNSTNFLFNFNSGIICSLDSRIIILPSLEREGFSEFDGWYEDENFDTPLSSYNNAYEDETTLYGRWVETSAKSTVSFETDCEDNFQNITERVGTVIELPKNVTKKGFMLVKWVDSLGFSVDFEYVIPSYNVTLRAIWLITEINDVNDFNEFLNNVNEVGMNYEGLTVTLGDDIDMSSISNFAPVAYNEDLSFDGTFDGRGHVISNLTITTYYDYVGLFGFSNKGSTVRNVVLDSSCSIKLTNVSNVNSIGGIFGTCMATDYNCEISNSVNMANITVVAKNEEAENLVLGAIIGDCVPDEKKCIIKNCANYGDIKVEMKTVDILVGGIIGFLESSGSTEPEIVNTLNYGVIDCFGVTFEEDSYSYDGGEDEDEGDRGGEAEEGDESDEGDEGDEGQYVNYVGGICGFIVGGTIKNSVNMGKLIPDADESMTFGAICGAYVDLVEQVIGCFWSEEGAGNSASGGSSSLFDDNFEFENPVSTGCYNGKSLIEALNAYSTSNGVQKWSLNQDSNDVKFIIDGHEFIIYNSQVILLPGFNSGDESIVFNGWYTDSEVSSLFTSQTINAEINLYGSWDTDAGSNNYNITFNATGGSEVANISAPSGTNVELPAPERDGHIFVGWVDTTTGDFSRGSLTLASRNVALAAEWIPMTISTPEDYLSFSSGVQRGESCEGQTIKLVSDIDFAEYTNIGQIGQSDEKPFEGTFDGHGYRISNLVIESGLGYVGLFGVSSGGATIRNVLLDKSCSFTSTAPDGTVYVGSIIASCTSAKRHCKIENSINMAPVELKEKSKATDVYIAGIIGGLFSGDYSSTVQNCANYGNVTISNTESYIYAGGIVSTVDKNGKVSSTIRNCINFGQITSQATLSVVGIGGIIAEPDSVTVSNCVSHGKISAAKADDGHIGTIFGVESGNSTFVNCFWDTAIAEGIKWAGDDETNLTIENVVNYTNLILSKRIVVNNYKGKSLVKALNAYADKHAIYSLSNWALNRNKNTIEFNISGRKHGSLSSEIILLPEPANYFNSERMFFYGWYTEPDRNKPLVNYTLSEPTTLYGFWEQNNKIYTVTFDVGEGEPIDSVSGYYGEPVSLTTPSTTSGNLFIMWVDENGAMIDRNDFAIPAQDTTLRAIWSIGTISTAEDLIAFANAVNSETRYNGKEVILENDIDMSGFQNAFNPITNFDGIFNGNGHTISGLRINASITSDEDVDSLGLFRYSDYNMTIKNLIIVDMVMTVLIEPDHEGTSYGMYVGGILGESIVTKDNPSKHVINNCLVMGSIDINSNKSADICVGGIAGLLSNETSGANNNKAHTIVNCASYVSISISGTVNDFSVGGIVGYCGSCTVTNCLSAMKPSVTLPNNFKPEGDLYIGGIAGHISRSNISCCVNIVSFVEEMFSEGVSAGSVVGYVEEKSDVASCYYNANPKYMASFKYEVNQGCHVSAYLFDENITLNSGPIVTALNENAKRNGLSRWTHLKFNTSDLALVPPVIVFTEHFELIVPPPANLSQPNEEKEFDGWFMDKEFSLPYSASSVGEGVVTVHAKWKNAPSEYVEIVFDDTKIGKAEAKEILSGYTNEVFIIEKFEVDSKTGETTIVIKFDDKETAINFVENIRATSSDIGINIKKVGYIPEKDMMSSSLRVLPYKLFFYLIGMI